MLSRQVDECKSLGEGDAGGGAGAGGGGAGVQRLRQHALEQDDPGRGLHSSTSQLNLSHVRHKKTPYTP